MSVAYVDSSVLIAIAFRDPGWEELPARLVGFSSVRSSSLLEAEVRSAYAREGRPFNADTLSRIEWVFPDRSLRPEIEKALIAGYLRGADLHHVATALYMSQEPESVAFVTLDKQQGAVAAALGFQT